VVGSNTFLDTLIIQSGGVLSNGIGYIGYETSGSNNTPSFATRARRGTIKPHCSSAIGARATSWSSPMAQRHQHQRVHRFFASASNNTAIVSGSNSVWNILSSLVIGSNAANDALVITNGGQVFDAGANIGTDAGNNFNVSVLVTGTNSL